MDRRTLLLASLSALAPIGAPVAEAARSPGRDGNKEPAALSPVPAAVAEALDRFSHLGAGEGANVACLVEARRAEGGEARWRYGHREAEPLFVGGAVNTFIMATFLRLQDAGKLDQRDLCVIDDSIRSLPSPVYLNLTGRTSYTNVLEAMVAHGDATATDAILATVGVKQVRELISRAGLKSVRIPDSTRRMAAWLAGAKKDADPGWQGLQAIGQMETFPKGRSPLNTVQSMQASALGLVDWYRSALAGDYFSRPGTLAEFQRIHAMADMLSPVAPPGALLRGMGGRMAWGDFQFQALAGQMLANDAAINFAFIVNWTRPSPEGGSDHMAAFEGAARDALARAAEAVALANQQR